LSSFILEKMSKGAVVMDISRETKRCFPQKRVACVGNVGTHGSYVRSNDIALLISRRLRMILPLEQMRGPCVPT